MRRAAGELLRDVCWSGKAEKTLCREAVAVCSDMALSAATVAFRLRALPKLVAGAVASEATLDAPAVAGGVADLAAIVAVVIAGFRSSAAEGPPATQCPRPGVGCGYRVVGRN